MNKVYNVLVDCFDVCLFVWYGFLLFICVFCFAVFLGVRPGTVFVLSTTYFLCLNFL